MIDGRWMMENCDNDVVVMMMIVVWSMEYGMVWKLVGSKILLW
jgi:hypothetical protein